LQPQGFQHIVDEEKRCPPLSSYREKSKPPSCEKYRSSGIFLQPEAHIITKDQLINEVRAIYAGLVMIKKKCIDIDKQQSENPNELKHVQ
jgi:hypothetical protein